MPSLSQLRARTNVARIDDERAIGNGLIVEMCRGWTFDAAADNRVRGADTLSELAEEISTAQVFAGPFDD